MVMVVVGRWSVGWRTLFRLVRRAWPLVQGGCSPSPCARQPPRNAGASPVNGEQVLKVSHDATCRCVEQRPEV
jgi:hypothetical protein